MRVWPVRRSRRKTSWVWFVSPPTRSAARELNASHRPSSESEASADGPEPGPPPTFRLSSRVVPGGGGRAAFGASGVSGGAAASRSGCASRSEEHTSELQSLRHLVCRLLLEKK